MGTSVETLGTGTEDGDGGWDGGRHPPSYLKPVDFTLIKGGKVN